MSSEHTKIDKIEHTVLFDMDGTLTPARKEITDEVKNLLQRLYECDATRVGVVSGSPYDYIVQQLGDALTMCPERTMIMPCNGTQLLRWDESLCEYEMRHETDMKEHMTRTHGREMYRLLISQILELQMNFVSECEGFDALTGHFVSYRKSMVNWSPVGREAKTPQREAFLTLDKKFKVREQLRDRLGERLNLLGVRDIDLKLGGTTSIDIHPAGWDKTYALNHCGNEVVWFVGDRCDVGGNDHTLWKELSSDQRSFSTKGPKDTVRIVETHILPCIQSS